MDDRFSSSVNLRPDRLQKAMACPTLYRRARITAWDELRLSARWRAPSWPRRARRRRITGSQPRKKPPAGGFYSMAGASPVGKTPQKNFDLAERKKTSIGKTPRIVLGSSGGNRPKKAVLEEAGPRAIGQAGPTRRTLGAVRSAVSQTAWCSEDRPRTACACRSGGRSPRSWAGRDC